jgi:hypothetical protein
MAEVSSLSGLGIQRSSVLPSFDEGEPIIHWKQEPPQLTPPRGLSSEYRLLRLSGELEKSIHSLLGSVSERARDRKESIETLSRENILKLKEAAARVRSSDTWTQLKRVADSVMGALSLVMGFSWIAGGGSPLAGGALIASGLLSASHAALCDSKAWDWLAGKLAHDDEETKKRLALLLPSILAVAVASCSMAGMAGAAKAAQEEMMRRFSLSLQGSMILFNSATSIGQGLSEARKTWAQADLTSIQDALTEQREELQIVTTTLEKLLRELRSGFKAAEQALQSAAQSRAFMMR